MYVFSEKTNQKYKTVEECEKAERAYDERIEKERIAKEKRDSERATRAKAVEDAYKTFNTLLNDFVDDYGSFHYTIKDENMDMFELLNWLFD